MENTLEIIKRSGLDYARAFIGYDYKNGAKPKYDGLIINKEDFTSLQFFKKRHELIGINKIAHFIWNDLINGIQYLLKRPFGIDSFKNLFENGQSMSISPNYNEGITQLNPNFTEIRNLSKKLFEESYKIISGKKRRLIEKKPNDQ